MKLPEGLYFVPTRARCPLGKCDGTGAIKYVERGEGPPVEVAEGVFVGPMTTYGTNLCECRTSLEPRDGRARWWTSETVYNGEWEGSVFGIDGSLSVQAEVPISDDNYIVKRPGNRYYPTLIDLTFTRARGGYEGIEYELPAIFADEARELAARLIEAADAADAIDVPCADNWAS